VNVCHIDTNLELSVSCVTVKCKEKATLTRYSEMDSERKHLLQRTSKGMVLVIILMCVIPVVLSNNNNKLMVYIYILRIYVYIYH